MPDGRPTRERRFKRQRLLSVWVPPALKRDILRIAVAENQAVSRTCAGLLRLGLGRYFELCDAKMAAPLLAKMRDLFSEDDPIPKNKNDQELCARARP